MSNVILTGDYTTDVRALLELLRDGTESLVVSCQLLESSESVLDRHHAKQNLERWTPIWRELDRSRGRDVQPAAGEPVYQRLCNGEWQDISHQAFLRIQQQPFKTETRILWTAPPAAPHGATGEPVADLHSSFEDAWAKALCSDEGVPGAKPLLSLSDPEQYRGVGVNAAWRWFQRGAQSVSPPAAAHGDEAVWKLVLPTPEQVMHVVMKFYWEDRRDGAGTTNWAANLGTAVVEYVARLNQAQSAGSHGDARVDNLAALTRRLVQALRKAAPDHALPAQALDYLGRIGLQGNPLRSAAHGGEAPERAHGGGGIS